MIILVAIILLLIFATLLIIPSLREKVKEIIKKILRDLKFNTVIMSITGAFLDLSFSLVTQILVNKNENWKFKNESKSSVIATWVFLLACLVGYIAACFIVLFKN
jgi:hypothetical protein